MIEDCKSLMICFDPTERKIISEFQHHLEINMGKRRNKQQVVKMIIRQWAEKNGK
jgi:hypothetical protein